MKKLQKSWFWLSRRAVRNVSSRGWLGFHNMAWLLEPNRSLDLSHGQNSFLGDDFEIVHDPSEGLLGCI